MINQTADRIITQLYETIFSLEYLQSQDILNKEDLKGTLHKLEDAYHMYLLLYHSLTGPVALSGYMPVEKKEAKEERDGFRTD